MASVNPLIHKNSESSDQELSKEASAYYSQHTPLQAQAELWIKILELIKTPDANGKIDTLPWWNLQYTRNTFTVKQRMQALNQRPDIRQQVTTQLTGMKQKAARAMPADLQATLIDSAIDQGDISLLELEEAFDAQTWAVYIFQNTFWNALANDGLIKIVEANTEREKQFIAYALDVFLKTRGSFGGQQLKPVLTHLDVRLAIDPEIWIKRIPMTKRIEVDRARLDQERKNPRIPFTAQRELQIVGLDTIVQSIDLSDLVPVIRAAGESMGFADQTLTLEDENGIDNSKKV